MEQMKKEKKEKKKKKKQKKAKEKKQANQSDSVSCNCNPVNFLTSTFHFLLMILDSYC